MSIVRCSDGVMSLRKDPFFSTGMHTLGLRTGQ